jgi:aminoglycoside phosphotransferase (APT) family kinase protein
MDINQIKSDVNPLDWMRVAWRPNAWKKWAREKLLIHEDKWVEANLIIDDTRNYSTGILEL